MIIKRLSLMLLVTCQLIETAHAQLQLVEIIVPRGTAVTTGSGRDIGILLGRPLGVVTGVGDCGSFVGDHHIFDAVFVHPGYGGRSTQANVIVVFADGAHHTGMQLTQFEGLGTCTGPEGLEYDKYRAYVQPRDSERNRFAAPESGSEIIVAIPDGVALTGGCYYESGEFSVIVGCGAPGSLYHGDVALMTGRSEGTISGGSCAQQTGDARTVVLVDSGAGRAARRTEIVVYYDRNGLRPGDRIDRFDALGLCQIGSVVYQQFRAFVQ